MRMIQVAFFVAAAIGVPSVSTASFASTQAPLSTSSPTIESTSLDGARLEIDASNEAVAPQEANAIGKLKIGKLKIGNPRKGIGNAIRKATGGKIGRVPKHIKHEGQKIERPTKMTHLDIE